MKINWKKTIGYGVVIWVVAFIVVSILVGFKMDGSVWRWLITLIAVIITAAILAKRLNLEKMAMAVGTGLTWVAVGILLDLIVTTRFTGMVFFNDWKIWVSYLVILIIPLFNLKRAVVNHVNPNF